MTKETSIVNLLFSAALAALFCLCSCTEKQHTTDPEPENHPIGFRPVSQAVMVKSGTAFPETIQKFGVWGIAGNNLNIQYLWNPDSFIDVYRQTDGTYKPATDAYWFSYSTHDFLALASNPSTVALPSVSISHTTNPNALNPSMTFSYDLSGRYAAKDYAYDLLGAAARNRVEKSIPASQDLVFWHLFSQIEISTSFSTDLSGNQIVGEVTAIHFKKVKTSGSYIVKYKTESELDVKPTPSTSLVMNISFSGSTTTFNIIPQDVKVFELYLDFKIQEGNVWKTYNNFKINLDVPANKEPYVFNNKYNWNISIGTKAAITFDVTVNEWQEATKENDGFEPEINM